MDFGRHLDGLIPKLQSLKHNPDAEVFFDLMSDAFVWSDEKLTALKTEEMGCLRAVFRYRTSLIIDKPDERFRGLWNQLREQYPAWIGFNPSRCQLNDDLTNLYQRRKISVGKYIKRLS